MSEDVVKRLDDLADLNQAYSVGDMANGLNRAADEIERLRAENEALREAAREAAREVLRAMGALTVHGVPVLKLDSRTDMATTKLAKLIEVAYAHDKGADHER